MIFDPFSPDFHQDPYPTYALLREQAPFLWHPETQRWYVSRYEDVSTLLRDRRLGRTMNAIQLSAPPEAGLEAFHRLSNYSMFDMEPPDHTRLRKLVSQVFTPKRVEGLRPKMEAAANNLLDRALAVGKFDLLEDYAVPLPVQVIADLLGIPQPDRVRLRPWSAAIVAMYELSQTREQKTQAERAASEFWDFLRWLAAERRKHPQDDLISDLASTIDAESGAYLSENELIATCILLLNAGHEATVNGFGNGMYALFRSPRQIEQLRTQPTPELIRTAVEEMLRFDSPLQLFKRWVLADMDYQGVHFQTGEQVALFFGSANRDPRKFAHPEDLDITRAENPHITFGAGIHFCLGAPLARLELNIALTALFRRAPRLQLIETPHWRDSFVIRGLKSLHVGQ